MPLSQVVVENWREFGGRMLRSRLWHLARLLAAMSAKMKSQNSAENVLFAWISVMVCSIFASSESVLSSLLQCFLSSILQMVLYLHYFTNCSICFTSEIIISLLLKRLFYSIFITSESVLSSSLQCSIFVTSDTLFVCFYTPYHFSILLMFLTCGDFRGQFQRSP